MLDTVIFLLLQLPPNLFLGVWALGCGGAVLLFGAVLIVATRPASDPFIRPRHRPAHAHRGDQADTEPRTGARHAGVGVTPWTAQHTAEAAARRGRHHTGERRIVGSLLDTQAGDFTVDDLAAMAGVR